MNYLMRDDELVISFLNNNSYYVRQYIEVCRRRGILPTCTDFLSYWQWDWSIYQFRRKLVTDYLRGIY